jgi:hypothetical protein
MFLIFPVKQKLLISGPLQQFRNNLYHSINQYNGRQFPINDQQFIAHGHHQGLGTKIPISTTTIRPSENEEKEVERKKIDETHDTIKEGETRIEERKENLGNEVI